MHIRCLHESTSCRESHNLPHSLSCLKAIHCHAHSVLRYSACVRALRRSTFNGTIVDVMLSIARAWNDFVGFWIPSLTAYYKSSIVFVQNDAGR